VRDLVFTILHEFGFTPEPDGIDADLTNIEAGYHARGGAFELLVDENNQIVGTIGLFPHAHRVCELRKMYLEREYRGRGLGLKMLEHAVETARRLGFWRIELETESRLIDAIRLYRRFGFQPIAGGRTCDRCDHAFYLDLEQPDRSGVAG
jgi:putative acetyltransferase